MQVSGAGSYLSQVRPGLGGHLYQNVVGMSRGKPFGRNATHVAIAMFIHNHRTEIQQNELAQKEID